MSTHWSLKRLGQHRISGGLATSVLVARVLYAAGLEMFVGIAFEPLVMLSNDEQIVSDFLV